MLVFLRKNIQRFLILFFTAISIILVILGVSRIKKTDVMVNNVAPKPQPQNATNSAGATTITGNAYQTPWGNAVASIVVKNGKILEVKMPTIPNSPPSVYAEPYLIDQALKSGGANIQGVSGATYTSIAFKSSLESAIAKANEQGATIAPTSLTNTTTQTLKPSVPRNYRDDEGEDDEEHEHDRD